MSALPYQQAFCSRNDFGAALFGSTVRCALLALCLGFTSVARAVDDEATVAGSDEDVTITQGADRTVFEYRQNGQLRMVKIVPAQGKAYYLVPADPTQGNGDLEHSGKLVPSWRIVEF